MPQLLADSVLRLACNSTHISLQVRMFRTLHWGATQYTSNMASATTVAGMTLPSSHVFLWPEITEFITLFPHFVYTHLFSRPKTLVDSLLIYYGYAYRLKESISIHCAATLTVHDVMHYWMDQSGHWCNRRHTYYGFEVSESRRVQILSFYCKWIMFKA